MLLLGAAPLAAQWTSDPSNPTPVCTAPGIQGNVQSFNDGEGGIYIFWRDTRAASNQNDIYGQYYDAAGVAQWEANGREIVNYENNINSFHILRSDAGKMVLVWSIHSPSGGNPPDKGVYAQELNANGEKVWAEDLQIRDGGVGNQSISGVRLTESGGNYYVAILFVAQGAGNRVQVSKFDGSGALLWPFGGTLPVGVQVNAGSSFGIASDHAGGCYVYHNSANAGGASIRCMRMGGDNPENLWPAWRNVTSDTQGLNGTFSGMSDAQGIIFAWVGNGPGGTGGNIYARKLNIESGLLDWNESTKHICAADGNQSNFFWKKSGNNIYMTWSDSRPGVQANAAVYAQKFNTNGVIFWEENGVQVANLGSYIPHPRFDLDDDNTMLLAYKASPAFVAFKVLNNGTVQWAPSGIVALTNANSPLYGDFHVVHSQGKFLLAYTRGSDNIFLTNVKPPQVNVTESVTACNSYEAYGELYQLTGSYNVEINEDTLITLQLTIVQNIAEVEVENHTLISVYDGAIEWYDCATEQPIEGAVGPVFTPSQSGSYALKITNGDCVAMSDCIEIDLGEPVSTQDAHGDKPTFNAYPNPGSDILLIGISESSPTVHHITLYDISGRVVMQQAFCGSAICEVHTHTLVPGVYVLEVRSAKGMERSKWVKR